MDKPPQPVIGLLGPASDTTDALNALLRQTPYPIQTAGTCDALFSLSGDYAAIVSDAGQQAELLDRLQRSGHRTTAIIHFPQSDSDPLPDPLPPTGCVYLCRPVAPQTLLTTIAQAVERWQLAAETKKLKIENDAYREQLSKQVTSRVEELLQSQEFLFTLTEVMTDSVLSLTGDVTDMRIEFANSAACRVFNYSRAEFIGQSMRMLYPEQAAFDACRQKLQQVLQANGPELRLEQHLRKKTGEHIWVENVTTFMYSDGRLQRVISILRDITGRKAKEAELQQRNEELAALNAIAAAINQTPSLDPVLKTALGQIEAALGLKHSEIWLLDRRTNLLRPRIHYGLPESFAKEIPAFKVGVGLPGVVAQTRHPLMVPDLATNPHYMRQRAARYKLKGALGIPLLAQDKVVGVMNFFTYGSTAFTPEIIASLETVGHLVGAAIENARLFDELQRQTQELSGLYETALATSSVLDVDLMLARLHDQVQQLLNPDTFMVALYNDNTNKFKIALAAELGRDLTPDVEHDRYPIEAGGLTGWVMRNKQPLLIGDILADPLPVDPKHLTEPSRAWLGVPLIARDQMIGAVSVQSFQPHAFNRADRRFLESIAGQVAIAIENARLFEAERLRHHEIEAVQRVSLSLTAPPKLPQVFEAILRAALNLVPALDTHIFLYTGTRLIFGAAMWADGSRSEPFSNPRAGGLTDVVSKTGELVAVNDMQNHPLFKDVSPEWTGAILGIPLKIGPTVVGVMNIAYPHPRQFPETELRVLSLLAAQAAIAIENARLFEQAQQEISERKRTEAALRESEEKYRTLIEQSNDAIYLIYNHKFEIINRKFKDLFDVTQTDVQAPDFSLLNLVVPSSRLLIEQHLARQESGQPTPNRVEFTALTGDRREIEVELSVSNFGYRDGIATQGILRDITDRKRLEGRLRQAQKMEAVGQLAGGIAHDFNNILTAIGGLISLSMEKVTPGSDLHEDLTIIHSQAQRAAILVSQLLAFARQQPLEARPLNLNRVILNLTNLLQRAIGENIELKTKLARQLKEINGDISALEQILTNLCLNARDAMPGGGVLSIHTEAVFLDEAYCKTNPSAQPGPYILLTISDTGSGMDEQTLTRIFDPFFTTKEVGRGSGLGLAMVFGLMKQLNGFIEVNSLPGRGSTFKLYFPTASGPSHHPPDDESPPLAGGTETILLIEDDPVVRKLVQRILTQVGYTVITAQNGQAALKLMQTESQRVHLIITDVVMPKMGGNQFYETVKEMPLNPKPRFIFMSGYETGDLHQKIGRELVAQVDFLSKPFSPATLTAKIREVLEAP